MRLLHSASEEQERSCAGSRVAVWQLDPRWEGSVEREECIMIAKLLRKLCFTRHYGAYGAHAWDAYAGDDRA
ncbi:hypothetical protein GCM10010442_66850 [Kitasatospora kifunensis]